jgi:RNA polymerase sigma factor (sigma-70 family)
MRRIKVKDTYMENKVQNMFTAYLITSLSGVRKRYIAKKKRITAYENYLQDIPKVSSYHMEEHFYRNSPEESFHDLESYKIFKAIMWLKDIEREIIYLYIFEEKTFAEIALKLHLSESVIKGRYYYALRKIRNRMRGEEK